MSFQNPRMVGFLLALLLIPSLSQANFSFEGYLTLSNGNIPASPAAVQFKILSSGAEGCLLYGEAHTSVPVAADGYVSIDVGSGSRTDSTGLTLTKVFDNSAAFFGLTCTSGSTYTPSIGDRRLLDVIVNGEDMGTIAMNPAPVANVASSVNGFTSSNLLRVENAGAPAPASALSPTQFTELTNLISGVSTQYAKTNAAIGAAMPVLSSQPSGVGPGSVWYDSTNNQLKYWNGSTAVALTGGGISSVLATAPIIASGTGSLTLSMNPATASQNGYLTMSDWMNFNSKLGGSLPNGQIWIGNGGIATPATVTGDATLAASGGLTVTGLNGRPVNASSPTTNQILKYNGSSWINTNLSTSDISSGVLQVPQGGTGGASFSPNSLVMSNGSGTALQSLTCGIGQSIVFDGSGYALCGFGGIQNNGSSFGSPMKIGTNDPYDLRLKTNSVEQVIINPAGMVGIGVSAPAVRLQVNGAIVSNEVSTGGGTVNFANANSVVLSSVGSSGIVLNGMIPGGHYTLIIEDPTSRTYSFTGCSPAKFSPANGATTASTTTIYEIYYRSSGTCLIHWQTGYL